MYQPWDTCGASYRVPGPDCRSQEGGFTLISVPIMTESPNAQKRSLDWQDFRITTDAV
jgi:hypothetical protein